MPRWGRPRRSRSTRGPASSRCRGRARRRRAPARRQARGPAGVAGLSYTGRARTRLIAVARGDEEPDLVIEGARVFSVFTREWLAGDVGIADGRIAGVGSFDGGERLSADGP